MAYEKDTDYTLCRTYVPTSRIRCAELFFIVETSESCTGQGYAADGV